MDKEYFRKFVTLEMDGVMNNKSFGSVIIESRNLIGKVNLTAQDLRVNTTFIVELVRASSVSSVGVQVYEGVSDSNGRLSFKVNFDANNVFDSKIRLNEFHLIILKIKNSKDLVVPVIGFIDTKKIWKNNYSPINLEKTTKPKKSEYTKVEKMEQKKEITQEEKIKNNINESIVNESTKKDDIVVATHERFVEKVMDTDKKNNGVEQFIKQTKNVKDFELNNDDDEDTSNMDDHLRSEEELFLAMINKVNTEFKELREIANLRESSFQAESVFKKDEEEINIVNLFLSNKHIIPFESQNVDVDWISIKLSDLVVLPQECHKLIKNNFFINAYKTFGELILGSYKDNDKVAYLIGVPDYYKNEYRQDIEGIGFRQFKPVLKKPLVDGTKGFWIMSIKSVD